MLNFINIFYQIVSIFLLLYIFTTYIGLPLLLFIFCRAIKLSDDLINSVNNQYFDIQIIIPCYNEDRHIESRIKNIFSQSYPIEKISVLVISDGSTDKTNEIVDRISKINTKVKLFKIEQNLGKNEAINLALKAGLLNQELLCLTDADSEFHPHALEQAVKFFSSPKVGLVSGKIIYNLSRGGTQKAEGSYWRLENFLREQEGKLGWLISCSGSIILLRKKLLKPISSGVNTDFALPLSVLAQGYQTKFSSKSIVFSLFPTRKENVLRRRQRTIIRALTTIAAYKKLLPWHLRQLIFWHKTARFWTFPVQSLLLLSNFLIIKAGGGPVWWVLFCGQVLFYGLALLGWLADRFDWRIPLVHLPYQFTLQNWVAFGAVLSYLRGVRVEKWTPPR